MATTNVFQQGMLFEENFFKRTYRSLTSNPEIALTELVANAWDAGALRVDITIPPMTGELLIVEDDGVGMSRDEFLGRWRTLSYNRLSHQGKKVVFPNPEIKGRLAFGRNGIGRHAMLCFNDVYSVVSRKDGRETCYSVQTTTDNPIQITEKQSLQIPSNLHGMRLSVEVKEHLPDPGRILDALSLRFVTDPQFEILVNGTKVETADLNSIVEDSGDISVTDKIKIRILFIDTTAAMRKGIYQGIAFWQSNRLVGEPSWILGRTSVLDGRTTKAKQYTFIVKSEDLEDFVREDWTGFEDCEEMEMVYGKVAEYVREAFARLNTSRIKELKELILQDDTKTRYQNLTMQGQYDVQETIDYIAREHPTSSMETYSVAVSSVMALAQSRNGQELLSKISSLPPDQIDALNDLLSKWDVRDALAVLDAIDQRISVIEAIKRLSQDKSTNELHVLHPLITDARWVFGPEYESREYISNQQLQTIAKKVFHSDKAKFLNPKKRPDLFIVDEYTYSVNCLEDDSGDSKPVGIKKILIIELKRGGFKIERKERDQAQGYVEDILGSKMVDPNVEVVAYVVGDSIGDSVSPSVTIQPHGIVNVVMFSQIVDTAHRRLFKLRDLLKQRYAELSDGVLHDKMQQMKLL